MSAPTCVRCAREMTDTAYACHVCGVTRPTEQLRTIADMCPAARDVAHGLSRHNAGPGASGKPGSRLPLDLAATAKLDAVQGSLTTWARHVAGQRQGATWVWMDDPIVEASLWLVGQLEWARHRREVQELLADVDACARIVAGIARGPAAQRYLGPCGATLCSLCGLVEATHVCEGDIPVWACDGDVYARDGAQRGACRTCGAEVASADRRAWLDAEVRAHAFRAVHIAEAYGVNVKTIRTWATRPRPDTGQPPLATYWRTEAGLITPWTESTDDEEYARRGPRLHYVGDVLDLAAADAARRETERARRERRAAAKAAEEVSSAAWPSRRSSTRPSSCTPATCCSSASGSASPERRRNGPASCSATKCPTSACALWTA